MQLIDRLKRPEFDLLTGFAEPLPVVVIARLLGVPEAMSGQLLDWSHDMVAMYQARRDRAVEERANAASTDFSAFLRAHVAARRTRPGDDLITELIAAEREGDRLDTDELVATCVLLLNAGHEATVHAIGNGVAAILAAGCTPERIFADAAATAATVEEVLRFDPPLHLFTPRSPRRRRGLRPPLPPRRDGRLPARGRQPRPGALRRAGPVRPGPASCPAPRLRRRHPLLRRRAARPARAGGRAADPLRAPSRPRAGRAAGLRRPLPLPRARGPSAPRMTNAPGAQGAARTSRRKSAPARRASAVAVSSKWSGLNAERTS